MAEPQVQLSERDKYIAALEDKLRKAGKAKRFVGSEDGALVTDYVTQQVNGIIKEIGGKKYLSDQQGYAYAVGQLNMAQKILAMLNGEANTDTEAIQSKLAEAKTDANT